METGKSHPWLNIIGLTAVLLAARMQVNKGVLSLEQATKARWLLWASVLECIGLTILPVPLYIVAYSVQAPLLLLRTSQSEKRQLTTTEVLSIICYCLGFGLSLLSIGLQEDWRGRGLVSPLTVLYVMVTLGVWIASKTEEVQTRLWTFQAALPAAIAALGVLTCKSIAWGEHSDMTRLVEATIWCGVLLWSRNILLDNSLSLGDPLLVFAFYASFLLALLLPAATMTLSLASSSLSFAVVSQTALLSTFLTIIFTRRSFLILPEKECLIGAGLKLRTA